MEVPIACLNGRFIPASEAKLAVSDLGVVFGAAVTEMIRTFGHRPFRLEEHLVRLGNSLQEVGFPNAPAVESLRKPVLEVVQHNAALLPAHHDLGIVVFVTAGHNLTYLGAAGRALARTPTVAVHTFPLPFELWLDKFEHGQHLVVSSVRAMSEDTLSPRIKSRNRLHWYIAEHEVSAVAAGANAVLLDHDGCLTETSAANVFVVIDDHILTPRPEHCLSGISQAVVQELATQSKLPYSTADLRPQDFSRASEAFTSSTPTCLLPVTRFNQQAVGNGLPGPIFQRLVSEWSQLVGLDIAQQLRQVAQERSVVKDDFGS